MQNNIPLIIVVLIFITLLIISPVLYIIHVKTTSEINGVFVFYNKKSTICQQMMNDLCDLQFLTFVDIASVPSPCIVKDTGKGLADNFSTGRINAGSVLSTAQAYHNGLLSELGYDNELPFFVKICDGKVINHVTGYPNSWFDNTGTIL